MRNENHFSVESITLKMDNKGLQKLLVILRNYVGAFGARHDDDLDFDDVSSILRALGMSYQEQAFFIKNSRADKLEHIDWLCKGDPDHTNEPNIILPKDMVGLKNILKEYDREWLGNKEDE